MGRKKMLKRIMILFFICFLTSSLMAEARIQGGRRIRIDNVEINEDKPIDAGETFNVSVNVIKNRILRFGGELRVYLICAGLPQMEIGKEDFIFKTSIKKIKTNKIVTVPCQIKDIDANWYQEKFNIKVMLYSNILGSSIRRDVFTKESVHIISKFWEKEKLRITKFDPANEWKIKSEAGGLIKTGAEEYVIDVNVRNEGLCEFDVRVVIYLIEKRSLGVPFVEGFGEERKEIGMGAETTIEPKTDRTFNIACTLRETEWGKSEFDVRAVLFADVDGILYEVDKSTIQTIQIKAENIGEAIKMYGPLMWIVFLAAMGTILLVAVTLRVLWPLMKIKRNEVEIKRREVEIKLQKIEEEEQKKRKKK